MTTTSTAALLSYANVQMAAEVMYPKTFTTGLIRPEWLESGNGHASRFTPALAASFVELWKVVDHEQNTGTGFSGTLFEARKDDPAHGITAGQLVMNLRSTEFIDDAARGNEATNKLEINALGWVFGQISDMEAWWNRMKGQVGNAPFTVTG